MVGVEVMLLILMVVELGVEVVVLILMEVEVEIGRASCRERV